MSLLCAVAIDCLANVYGVDASGTGTSVPALMGLLHGPGIPQPEPVYDMPTAEKLKDEGNTLVSQQQYVAAIDKYTQAIKAYPKSAAYYSNRSGLQRNPSLSAHYRAYSYWGRPCFMQGGRTHTCGQQCRRYCRLSCCPGAGLKLPQSLCSSGVGRLP